MRDIWIISDTHFGHSNIIKYCNRPFSSAKEMDDCMMTNWNETVKDGDIVYHLGDVYFGHKEARSLLPKLKGRKRLILGNHDNGKDEALLQNFQKILMWRMFPEFGLLMTHVPVHQSTLERPYAKRKMLKNIHGHIHDNESPKPHWQNVCVEWTEYKPIHIEDLALTAK